MSKTKFNIDIYNEAKSRGYVYNTTTGYVYGPTGVICNNKSNRYLFIYLQFNNRINKILVHRYAFYITYGYIPTLIDHINKDKKDNRISNLREVTKQENSFNTNAKGCSFDKRRKKWQSYINRDGKKNCLGFYDTEEEAHKVYLDAKKTYHSIC